MPIFYAHATVASQTLAHQVAAQAEGTARRSRTEVQEIQERLDRLALLTEALWSLLKDRSDTTDEELLEHVRAVDLQDGVLDGKVRRGASECASCGRMVGKHHLHCIYCGAETQRPPFDGV